MESNVRMETVHTEVKKTKKMESNGFSHPNWSPQEFHPLILDCLYKLVLTGITPPNTQLHWMVPNIAHFIATLKLQMKQGLQGQTRVQTNGDFEDTFVTYSY
jgi:hypothetical protein